MAMLAEKRQRTKWSLNPMGNDWAKDENKFGQRMLEKMGWEPGTGLGIKGQGRTDIIKMSQKCDTRGLGCEKPSNEDNWQEQIVNFDSLLAELNGTSRSNEVEAGIIPSLEEKSKASRARVHYHKFTRGKDVSQYSSKDLKCILPLSNKKYDTDSVKGENDMYEYFKNKSKLSNKTKENTETFIDEKSTLSNNIEYDVVNEEENICVKKKKRKKKHKNMDQLDNEETIDISPKKKSKKSITSENNTEANSNIPSDNENVLNITEDTECNITNIESSVSKKCKKKKKKKRDRDCENGITDFNS